MDLTLSRTLTNFTNIRYSISHVGGAFPAIEDRFIKTNPALEILAKEVYKTRYALTVHHAEKPGHNTDDYDLSNP